MQFPYKTFVRALELATGQFQKSRAFLNDKRLTQNEKTILAGFLSLRKCENEEIVVALSRLSCENDFVESQRLFCMGVAYNNLTLLPEARQCLEKAVALNVFPEGKQRKILAIQNLFTLYINAKELQLARNLLPNFDEQSLLYNSFTLSTVEHDFANCSLLMPEADLSFDEATERQQITYLYDLLDFHILQKDFEGGVKTLVRIKKLRNYRMAPIVKYFGVLLDFLQKDSPLYLYDKDFAGFPLFYHQVRCLKFLETGSRELARLAWAELMKLRPSDYKEDFQCDGHDDIFSLCLKKILNPPTIHAALPSSQGNLVECLIAILESSSGPINNDELHRQLWGTLPESKEDLKKLSKLVVRAREKFGVDIRCVKGAYSLKGLKKVS